MDIVLRGVRTHTLKNFDVRLPRYKFIVVTGVSGSGKSSLIYDTLYAEGQRRYAQTFSPYARQFLQNLDRPDLDSLEGLSPVIAMEQHRFVHNPRSTVGTVTRIYDYLRLLYSRIAEPHSLVTGEKLTRYTEEELVALLRERFAGKRIQLLAPIVRARKGQYREELIRLAKQGLDHVRIDGEWYDLSAGIPTLSRNKVHDIEVLVDTLDPGRQIEPLQRAVHLTLKLGKRSLFVIEKGAPQVWAYSLDYVDPATGTSFDEPQPNTFSHNSRYGACPTCHGMGTVRVLSVEALFPDPTRSAREALAPTHEDSELLLFWQNLLRKNDISYTTPWQDVPAALQERLIWGTAPPGQFFIEREPEADTSQVQGYWHRPTSLWEYIQRAYYDERPPAWIERYVRPVTCPDCGGQRLRKESLAFRIAGRSIGEIGLLELSAVGAWLESLPEALDPMARTIGEDLIRETRKRVAFLEKVGLGYLSLFRPLSSLSGGEAQRVRLAAQLGVGLTEVLYILDEPSIGLHPRDNRLLLEALKALRDQGSTVIVIEHDEETMREADWLIEIGPVGGKKGGYLVAQGPYETFLQQPSLTAAYLKGEKDLPPPPRRTPTQGWITLRGASGHNLKNLTVRFPLGALIVVAGVSGSGKSSLILETLYPALLQRRTGYAPGLPYTAIEGAEAVDKVILVDQNPIGRTPRSNPATYIGLMDEIRKWFAELPLSRARGYKPGRFSFNVKNAGRCETCQGAGVQTVEMGFLPPVYVTCPSCHGQRYNPETLEVRYKGKNISDILRMSVSEARLFFEAHPKIVRYLAVLEEIGLGYLPLGQPSPTLSGGEAQRIKLAEQLVRPDTQRTFYILDEPSTGLHKDDIAKLMAALHRLVARGNTVLIIEHNLDILWQADWVIELGPGGGALGGQLIAEGPPEVIARAETPTGAALRALRVSLPIP